MNIRTIEKQVIFLFILSLLSVWVAGGRVDVARATDPLQMAAESGDATAQYKLGLRYNQNGVSVEDFKKGFFWIKKAALQGMAKARFSVGDMYCSGQGVEQSYLHAYVWHHLAAAGGVDAAEQKMEILQETFLTSEEIKDAVRIAAQIEKKINNVLIKKEN